MSPRNFLFATVTLAAAAGCIRLGVWQVHRLSQRRAANTAVQAIRDAPPVNLNDPHEEVVGGRLVIAQGRFLAAGTVILRGRSLQGSPGVVLATPMALEGSGDIVMVVRGFVPAADAASADPVDFPPPDAASIAGIAVAIGDSGKAERVIVGGRETWRRLDLLALRERFGASILAIGVQLLPDSSQRGFPIPLRLEELTDGPHLSYAIQWFSFAAIALVGGVIWLRRGNQNA